MRQLALDLIARAEPSLDNFVEGPNRELLSVLRAVAAGPHLPPRVHLWGEPGCGKTHLLRALATLSPAALQHGLKSSHARPKQIPPPMRLAGMEFTGKGSPLRGITALLR